MLRSMMLLCTTSFLSVSTSEPAAISKGLDEPRTAPFDCDPELHGVLCQSDLPASEPPSPGVRPPPTGILAARIDAKPSHTPVKTDSVDVVCAWSLALSCTREIMARAQCLSRGLLNRAPLPCKRHGQRSYVTQCRIETARKSAELGQFVLRNGKNGCNFNVSGCFLSFVLKLKTCCQTFLRRVQQSFEEKGVARLGPQLPVVALVIPAPTTSVIAGGVGFPLDLQ